MKLILKLLASFLINASALLLSARWVPAFDIRGTVGEIAILIIIFTALNLFLKPILKFVMTPVIILTLGLGLLLVNAAMLYVLDFLSETLTIHTMAALGYSTVIISAVNFILHWFVKK